MQVFLDSSKKASKRMPSMQDKKMEEMKSDNWISILLKLNKPKREESLSDNPNEETTHT